MFNKKKSHIEWLFCFAIIAIYLIMLKQNDKEDDRMSGEKYDRLKTIDIKTTLNAIGEQVEILKKKGNFEALKNGIKSHRNILDGVEVHLTSLRLLTFYQKGTVCSCCGLESSYFAFERNAPKKGKEAQGTYHLNLWGINEDGEEVLFTHDHTLARSLGGADNGTNTTTMCTKCNNDKSKGERILAQQKREAEKNSIVA